jgi:hypothetical protein
MAEPPLFVGPIKFTTALAFPNVADTAVGAVGAVAGVTAVEAGEAAPVPALLVALTLNV